MPDSPPPQPPTSEAKLYVILGSHACRTGMLMLEHKRIGYRCVTMPTGMQKVVPRLLGFPGATVPALNLDGKRVQTNREIARFLDDLVPAPALFPAEPSRRAAVEEAETWADEVFQMHARRLTLAGARHGPDGLTARGGEGRLGPLLWKNARVRRTGSLVIGRLIFAINERSERELFESLPQKLDRIDAWIDAGVLDGEDLNAADYALATSLALLCYRPDIRPQVEARPAGALVERVLPEPTPAG